MTRLRWEKDRKRGIWYLHYMTEPNIRTSLLVESEGTGMLYRIDGAEVAAVDPKNRLQEQDENLPSD